MNEIRLSVAIANYNHGHFLEERIQSILEQLDLNDEIVIVDDGSTDDSVNIINRFVLQDFRVKLLRNERNLGVVKSANRAIRAANGNYLASLSADDRLLPGFIEKTMKILKENPTIPLCCSNCAVWFDDVPEKDGNQIYSEPMIEGVTTPQIFSSQEIAKVFFKTNFWIPGHTTIIKRSLVLEYGALNENFGPFCDWHLLHSIALDHGASYIPEDLSVLRTSADCYSATMDKNKTNRWVMSVLQAATLKRKKFRSSGLLSRYVRKRLFQLCLCPQYWDFVALAVYRYFYRKFERWAKSKLKFN